MGKQIPWHGKLNHVENKCPHCGAEDEYSDVSKTVMELSAQHYKRCIKCKGEYVDTYLIVWGDDEEEEGWTLKQRWESEDNIALFGELMFRGFLEYDDQNPDTDSDYYNIPQKSIHFIKGDD